MTVIFRNITDKGKKLVISRNIAKEKSKGNGSNGNKPGDIASMLNTLRNIRIFRNIAEINQERINQDFDILGIDIENEPPYGTVQDYHIPYGGRRPSSGRSL